MLCCILRCVCSHSLQLVCLGLQEDLSRPSAEAFIWRWLSWLPQVVLMSTELLRNTEVRRLPPPGAPCAQGCDTLLRNQKGRNSSSSRRICTSYTSCQPKPYNKTHKLKNTTALNAKTNGPKQGCQDLNLTGDYWHVHHLLEPSVLILKIE